MKEEWKEYLHINAPDLYDHMLKSVKYQIQWRDEHIKNLTDIIKMQKKVLDKYNGLLS